jgi:MoxR-like ATPase
VIELVRQTRDHPDIRVGSSVRGAIDLVRLATSLARRRQAETTDWRVGLDSALVALSGRIRLPESCSRRPEEVIRELYEKVFGTEPVLDSDDQRAGDAPGGA